MERATPSNGDAFGPGPVTRILGAVSRGEAGAEAALYDAVYGRLHAMANGFLRDGRGQTLQPTALVHETYLRLLGSQGAGWEDRRHFFGCAARAMRSILVDAARARGALKRGGDRRRVVLADHLRGEVYDPDTVIAVHEALEKLSRSEPEIARIVELRFYAGLSLDETADVLGVSRRSVCRRWEYARAWLFREIAA